MLNSRESDLHYRSEIDKTTGLLTGQVEIVSYLSRLLVILLAILVIQISSLAAPSEQSVSQSHASDDKIENKETESIRETQQSSNTIAHYTGIGYVAVTLLILIMLMIVMVIIIRSLQEHILRIVKSYNNYPEFAGIALALSWIFLALLTMDCVNLYNFGQKTEFWQEPKINIIVTLTLAWDGLAILQFWLCILYLCCTVYDNYKTPNKRCLKRVRTYITTPYFYIIFGTNKVWKENPHNIWVIICLVIVSLFSLVSHTGYIVIASVLEPIQTKASVSTLPVTNLWLCLLVSLCYKALQSKILMGHKETNEYLEEALVTSKVFTTEKYDVHTQNLQIKTLDDGMRELQELDMDPIEDYRMPNFSGDTFLVAFLSMGVLAVGFLIIILAQHFTIPIAEYIEIIANNFIIALTSLITFEVLKIEPLDTIQFVQSQRKGNRRKLKTPKKTEAATSATSPTTSAILHKRNI